LAVEYGIQPSQIHRWVATVLAEAERAFENGRERAARDSQAKLTEAKDRQIKRLEE